MKSRIMFKRFLAMILVALLLIPGLSQAKTLSNGSKGSSVTQLQKRLIELGISTGKADGIYGTKTTKGVKEAQRLLQFAGYEVEINGIADDQFQTVLYSEEAEDALRTLCTGSTGKRVKSLQQQLSDLGLFDENVSGTYDEATAAAVKVFQQTMLDLGAENIQADGVANPATVELLSGDLAAYHYPAPQYYDAEHPESLVSGQLYAKAAILIDAPTGEMLLGKNENERMYPASTTKMMTLLLALDYGNLEETVTIPKSAGKVPENSSVVPISVGEKMRMIDLLYAMMIRSGNDASNAVAELCAGNIDTFVKQMNTKAKELGMSGTHYVNAHGYHNADHYTTAADLAILARCGLTNTEFCKIVTCLSYTMPKTNKHKERTLKNKYEIFQEDSEYYIQGAAGIKSGHTSQAGFCYVGAAQRDGKTLIAVVLGESSREKGWIDLKRLFEYGFSDNTQESDE